MGGSIINRMRSHAEEINRVNINNLSHEIQEELRRKHGEKFQDIITQNMEARNRLKLSIYARNLTSTQDINYESWILANPKATQVLINTIQPGALHYTDSNGVRQTGEDGIFGPMTQRCVKNIFGIHIDIPGRSTREDEIETSVLPDSTGEAAAISAALTLSLRRAMENDPRLKDQLRKMGIRLERRRNPETGQQEEEFILPDNFEDTPEYAQIKRYLDALHLTNAAEYTSASITDAQRREKLDHYLFFVEEGGNFVMDRKYISYKLIHSIYQDLLRDPNGPYLITQDGKNGNYVIVKQPISRDEDYKLQGNVERIPEDHPYATLVENGRTHSSYLDFARTYSLVENNHMAFAGNEFLGQRTLVRSILERHGITGVSDEHIQNPNLLLADWADVNDQINERLEELTDVRDIQELLYVQDLIEGGQWQNRSRNEQVFREINVYGKGFLEAKKLIQDQFPGLDAASGEENIGTMLKNIARENMFLGIALAIPLLLFSGTRKWGAGILIGLFGAQVAGGIIDSTQQRVGGNFNNDNLEIVRIMELRYSIKGQDAPNGVLNKMYAENDRRFEQADSGAEQINHIQNPLVLGKVVHEIHTRDKLRSLKIDDPSTIQKIKSELTGETITGDEFNSNIRGRTSTLSEQDVLTAYEILLTQKNEGDIYLADVLVESGIDKVYHDYNSNWFSFTESGAFDTVLHDELRPAWTSADTVKRKELLRVMQEMSNHIITGRVDASADALGYGASLMEKMKSLFTSTAPTGALILGPDLDTKKQRISDLKTLIDGSALDDDTLKTSLKDIIDKYVVLLEKEAEFQQLRSSWYSSEGNSLTYYSLTRWLQGKDATKANYEDIGDEIGRKKSSLDSLKSGLDNPLYSDLLREIDTEIIYLERMEREVIGKIIALATGVEDIIDGTGSPKANINTDIGIGSVVGVSNTLHQSLAASIGNNNLDIFGALNTDLKPTLIDFYNRAAASSINGVDAGMTIGSDIWNGMKRFLIDHINPFPGITMPTSIPSVPQAGGLVEVTSLEDLEVQIKLGLIEEYFIKFGPQIEALRQVKTTYEPLLDEIVTRGGQLNPDQQRLKNMLSTDFDTLIRNIETKIESFAALYTAGQKMNDIQSLSTNSTSSLDTFIDIQGFLNSFTGMDGRISSLKAKADIYLGASNSVSTHLIPSTTLQTAFETKKAALRNHVESAGVLEYTDDMSVADIRTSIASLEKAKLVLGSPTDTIDRKIIALREKLLENAKISDIRELRVAIKADKNSLDSIQYPNSEQRALKSLFNDALGQDFSIEALQLRLQQYTEGQQTRLFDISKYPQTHEKLKKL